ncbi:protein of unknown function [Cyanobium sp. NIES-981]|nr:protein of unknown function [Cyanobium sp. NIES-981]
MCLIKNLSVAKCLSFKWLWDTCEKVTSFQNETGLATV